MVRSRGFVLVLALVLTPVIASAECFVLTGEYLMARKSIELVFSGRVLEITRIGNEPGYRATFDVDRVWKGSVPRRFDLYVWEFSPEMPQFTKGERYVALAKSLTEAHGRKSLGIDGTDTVVFTPIQCSDAVSPTIERELGAGYAPKQQ